MFNATSLVIAAFVERLEGAYRQRFGDARAGHPALIAWVARSVLERIADTDALYHNVEHTIMVTLVGQEILRGKDVKIGGVTADDWLHFVAALLCHDVGYLRGACLEDTPHAYVSDMNGGTVCPPRGASDAFLTPYHVDRGKVFVRERLGHIDAFDTGRLQAAIELTRFPVPQDEDHKATDTEPGLVRAADLIGQLADPQYMRKINALYYEFVENGAAAALGYGSPADLADNYPRFYWKAVRPYIGDGLDFLNATQAGKQWVANLYGHVFAAEHEEFRLGPEPRLDRANVAK